MDYIESIAEIALGKLSNPVGHIVANRTSLAARGHLAVEAALCLADGLAESIVFRDFFEFVHLMGGKR